MRRIHTSQCLLLRLALLLLLLLTTLLAPVLARLVIGSLAEALAEGCGLVVLDALVVFLTSGTALLAPLLASLLGVLVGLDRDRLGLGLRSGLVPVLLGLLNNGDFDCLDGNGFGLLSPATTTLVDVPATMDIVVA